MKKKILTLCLVAALAATAMIGGTMAYFTDTDVKTNTFTLGNVDIALQENYVQDSELMPGVTVNKDARVENTGDNDAYVWVEILIPAALDDNATASQTPDLGDSLHFSFVGANCAEYAQKDDANADFYNATMTGLWEAVIGNGQNGMIGTETIDSVIYNKYLRLYEDVLESGGSTSYLLDSVCMDKKVTQCTNTAHAEDCLILTDGNTHYTRPWKLIVRAYAIQSQGFADVSAARNAYNSANS